VKKSHGSRERKKKIDEKSLKADPVGSEEALAHEGGGHIVHDDTK